MMRAGLSTDESLSRFWSENDHLACERAARKPPPPPPSRWSWAGLRAFLHRVLLPLRGRPHASIDRALVAPVPLVAKAFPDRGIRSVTYTRPG